MNKEKAKKIQSCYNYFRLVVLLSVVVLLIGLAVL